MNHRSKRAATGRARPAIIRSWDDVPVTFTDEAEEAAWWDCHELSDELLAQGIHLSAQMRAELGFPPARES